MQNPRERDIETRLHDTVLSSVEPMENASLEPADPAPPAYKPEPLFNKKVMLVWAVGAAIVWFAVSFVLPIAFESAKSAIVQSVKEAEGTGSNVVIDAAGHKITIHTQPAQPAGTAAPPAKPVTPAPAPATPANPPSPADLQQHRK